MDRLSPRQQQIVALIARGLTNKEIASELGIAHTTAQKHQTNALLRLGVSSRAAAVYVAYVQDGEPSPPVRRSRSI